MISKFVSNNVDSQEVLVLCRIYVAALMIFRIIWEIVIIEDVEVRAIW